MNAAYSSVLVQNLKVTLLDQKRGAAPASMLDCAAHMLFCFDEPEGMYSAGVALHAGAIPRQSRRLRIWQP